MHSARHPRLRGGCVVSDPIASATSAPTVAILALQINSQPQSRLASVIGELETTPASLEVPVAKGQKRSNREFKKPKKTAAERAKVASVPVIGLQGKSAKDGQTPR